MKRRDFIKRTAAGGAGLALYAALPSYAMERGRAFSAPATSQDFNRGWQFLRAAAEGAEAAAFGDAAWEAVTLPHTANVEALVIGPPGSETYQWQGTSWYRKHFEVGPEAEERTVLLKFEAAMNVADVWLNGEYLGQHLGGYLPFVFDVSEHVRPGGDNVVAVRLDNTDNPVTGPKPLEQLDFNMYGGLYRDVHLIVKDRLHITDPLLANEPASGGVFVRYPDVSEERADVRVQVHVANDYDAPRTFRVHAVLKDDEGRTVAEGFSEPTTLAAVEDVNVVQHLEVLNPRLWSAKTPQMHTLHTSVVSGGSVVDEEVTRLGIRRFEITKDGFWMNGEPMFLRGTNRHQEYPYVGYALGNAAQYRDAKRIKDAGFDYVRLSHYPHDQAFMDACDELGLVVMDCIPGWQYFNREDERFAELQYENSRQLIRRDRNHPCVILWEVSLNETWMTDEFIEKTQAIAHEEYPSDQCYTCGWTEGYDVFIQARQHGGCHDVTDEPCVVSEYGDWEYYAQNAGLEQDAWADLAADEANSRQLRWHGERAMLQQATNFQEAHNDNLTTIAFADGLWVMYDYNRGYAPDIESSGCMDLFRLPKFSYYFFQSQRDPGEQYDDTVAGPMAFIANYWTPDSPTEVRVFSNADEVALYLNGELVERRQPDRDRISTHLKHPPFTFDVNRFESGTLEAVAYLDGREAARHVVRTPGTPEQLDVWVDRAGRDFAVNGKDIVIAHAALRDEKGTTVPDAWENVFFGATGPVKLVGANPFSSEAGVASILVQTDDRRPRAAVYALSIVHDGDYARILHGATSAGGDVEPYEVRWADDGTAPTRQSSRYDGPVPASDDLRAALFVDGEAVVQADVASDKFRIAGSTAPEQQEEH